MMREKLIVLGACCALLLTACQSGAGVQTAVGGAVIPERIIVQNADAQVITVSAKESVKVVPDMAQIIYAVTTQNKDAAACQEENGKKVDQLVAALKELGVEEKSIQTSNQDLRPQQDWENNGAIVGYEMNVQLTVSDLPIGNVGEILTKSVTAGVNEIQSVSFLSSSYDESYEAALKEAIAMAQKKAQALADASGSTLGHAVNITERGSNQAVRYENAAKSVAMDSGAGAAAYAEMMPGEISIEAEVSVDFAIQ